MSDLLTPDENHEQFNAGRNIIGIKISCYILYDFKLKIVNTIGNLNIFFVSLSPK